MVKLSSDVLSIPLVAADLSLSDTRHLADLLREKAVEQFVDPRQGQGRGTSPEDKDRRVRRIDLPVGGRNRHRQRKSFSGYRDGRLHILRRGVDVAAKIELNHDLGGTDRALRRKLSNSRYLRKLTLQRSSDRNGHRLGARARHAGGHLYGREIDLRQGGNRQERKGSNSHEGYSRHQQGCRDRPANE